MGLDPETTKALIQMVPEHTFELLFDPQPNAIGQALGGLLKGALSWPIKLGIKKDAEFTDLANQVANKYENVPENNKDESKILLLIKALQQVEYQIDIQELRRLYSNLIVNTVDNRKK